MIFKREHIFFLPSPLVELKVGILPEWEARFLEDNFFFLAAHSSRGLGHLPLKEEITGSNPVCATLY